MLWRNSGLVRNRFRNLRRKRCGFLAVATLLLMNTVGCGYGEVSPLTYEYSKALYSAANREDADQLEKIQVKVNDALQSGELTDQEAGWLQDIVDAATAGNWDTAEKSARRLMLDQVKK